MQAFGWTWEYVDGLDLPRVDAIYRGLRKRPPIHWIGRAFVKMPGETSSPGEGGGGAAAATRPSEMFEGMGGRLLDG